MQIVFNIPDAALPRIRAAIIKQLPPADPIPSDAELLDMFRAQVIRAMKGIVLQFEEREAVQAATDAIPDVEIT